MDLDGDGMVSRSEFEKVRFLIFSRLLSIHVSSIWFCTVLLPMPGIE